MISAILTKIVNIDSEELGNFFRVITSGVTELLAHYRLLSLFIRRCSAVVPAADTCWQSKSRAEVSNVIVYRTNGDTAQRPDTADSVSANGSLHERVISTTSRWSEEISAGWTQKISPCTNASTQFVGRKCYRADGKQLIYI